jgi:hypothetical protein
MCTPFFMVHGTIVDGWNGSEQFVIYELFA